MEHRKQKNISQKSLIPSLSSQRRWAFGIAFLGTLSLSISLDIQPFWESFNGNHILYLVVLVGLYLLAAKALANSTRRKLQYALPFAVLLALTQVIGYTIDRFQSFDGISDSVDQVVKYFIAFGGYLGLFFCVTVLLLDYAVSRPIMPLGPQPACKKRFLIFWALLLLAWSPYFINYYPGILSPDSVVQVLQALGERSVTNHHPAVHTFVIYLCLQVGFLIGGEVAHGVAIYSILQTLFMSGVFAYTVYFLYRKGAPRWMVYASQAYFMLFTVHPLYAVTMWKDQPFSCLILLFILQLFQLVEQKNLYFHKKSRLFLFCMLALGVMLFRNNGVYLVVISLPVFFAFLPSCRKQLAIAGAICLVLHSAYLHVLLPGLGVQQGSIAEALSVPVQQLARVDRDYRYNLEPDERDFIDSYFNLPEDVSSIGQLYDPQLSDPVKAQFDTEQFHQTKGTFLKGWFFLFFKYPDTYFESFFSNNVGYWYSQTAFTTARTFTVANQLGLETQHYIPGFYDFIMKLNLQNVRYFPIVSMIFSMGFHWILFVFCGVLLLYKKQFLYLLPLLPLFVLWLTCMASPVHAEFRYMYGFFTCMPLISVFVFGLLPTVDKTI